MTTIEQLQSKAYRLHVKDQVLAILRDRGPMTTPEIADVLPDWEWENDRYRWSTRVSTDWLRADILYPLYRKGQVERTPKDPSRPVMWWTP